MKVKELIEQLKNFDEDKDVIIRFCVSAKDEIGYCLEPAFVNPRIDDIAIYGEYTTTKEDCDFIGQLHLTELWEKEVEK